MWDGFFFQDLVWAVSQLGIMAVIAILLRSGNRAKYPLFAAYLVFDLLQGATLLFTYYRFGYLAKTAFVAYWITQGVVLMLRWLAISELCRHILKRFSGIWILASRILLGCAFGIIGYSILVSDWHGPKAVIAASRCLELAVAGVVIALFLFSRYYKVPLSRQNRALAAGFCLYSCSVVLHNTFEHYVPVRFLGFLNIGIMLVFCLSLLVWGRALRFPVPQVAEDFSLLPIDSYQQLSPAINERLRGLNERLTSVWKMEAPLP